MVDSYNLTQVFLPRRDLVGSLVTSLCYVVSQLLGSPLKIQMRNLMKSKKIIHYMYSKTCLKRPLKHRQNKGIKTNGSLMKVESIAE